MEEGGPCPGSEAESEAATSMLEHPLIVATPDSTRWGAEDCRPPSSVQGGSGDEFVLVVLRQFHYPLFTLACHSELSI